VLQSCSAVSMLATSSLLTILAYHAWIDHRASQKCPLQSGRKYVYPQGYFWLVNLFVAGTPSQRQWKLSCRSRAKLWQLACKPLVGDQLHRSRQVLQFAGNCPELWRPWIGVVDPGCGADHIFDHCGWTWLPRVGD